MLQFGFTFALYKWVDVVLLKSFVKLFSFRYEPAMSRIYRMTINVKLFLQFMTFYTLLKILGESKYVHVYLFSTVLG